MAQSGILRLRDVRAAFRLIGQCAELGADPWLWRERLFAGLCRLTGSVGAIGGESEGKFGGPDMRLYDVVYSGFDRSNRQRHQRYLAEQAHCTIDVPMIRFMAIHRTLTTRNHEQLIKQEEWHRSKMYNEFFRPSGIDDRILAVGELSTELDAPASFRHGISLYREVGGQSFSQRDRRLVHLVFSELTPLVGNKLATFRPRNQAPLSPRLRQVLDLLLSGCSDKEIAGESQLAVSTVREYVTTIYRRYGVSNRARLLALFLDWSNQEK